MPGKRFEAIAAVCSCGNAVFLSHRAGLDDEAKKEIGDLVAGGYQIKQVSLTEARAIEFGCQCEPAA